MYGSQHDNLVACNFSQVKEVPSKLKSNMEVVKFADRYVGKASELFMMMMVTLLCRLLWCTCN